AFAGGPLRLLGHAVAPTAVVVRVGARVLRLAPPLARVRAGAGGWHVQARSPRWTVALEGEAAPDELYALPVPVPGERATVPRSSSARPLAVAPGWTLELAPPVGLVVGGDDDVWVAGRARSEVRRTERSGRPGAPLGRGHLVSLRWRVRPWRKRQDSLPVS